MAKVIAAVVGVMALVFIIPILSAAVGAFCGLVVGWFFPDSLSMLSQAMGIEAAPYQLGAIFGFVGGFFKSSSSSSS